VDCDICGARCDSGVATWHFVCPSCATERSTLAVRINDAAVIRRIDEGQRAQGLAAVRADGYRTIIATLERLPGLSRRRLLEVGSAHGWFLREAAGHFDEVVGVEPDDAVRTQPPMANVSVRPGFFPDVMAADELFDVIVFNDVFEHIPGTVDIARAIAAHLAPGGVALLSLPVADGFIYRTAKRLARLGYNEPFERLWQVGYPSPHLYYFSHRGVVRLFEAAWLPLACTEPLPAIKIKGLWPRIRYGEPSAFLAIGSYAAALAMAPVLGILSPDTVAFFFRRGESPSHA
jgi:SAM-dependent methyltransferase